MLEAGLDRPAAVDTATNAALDASTASAAAAGTAGPRRPVYDRRLRDMDLMCCVSLVCLVASEPVARHNGA